MSGRPEVTHSHYVKKRISKKQMSNRLQADISFEDDLYLRSPDLYG